MASPTGCALEKDQQQLDELVTLQRKLLQAAALVVKPGGTLVYSTCSLESEENEEQARWFVQQHDGWNVESSAVEEPLRVLRTDEGFLQTWPTCTAATACLPLSFDVQSDS
jgi:16S rRNA (cytosine967-C5)-methyltransferase